LKKRKVLREKVQRTLNGKLLAKSRKKEKEIRESIVIPRLRDYLGYDVSLMRREVPIRFGRRDYYADLVFYTVTHNVKQPFLVVETKAPNQTLDWLQAESYAQRLKAPYFLVTDGETWNWYKTGERAKSSQPVSVEVHPPKRVGEEKLVKFQDIRDCMQVMRHLHNVIWNEKSTTPEEALGELTKFLVAKIIDEKEVSQHAKIAPEFVIKKTAEDPLDIKNRTNKLLMKAKRIDPDIFVEVKPEITLKPYSVVKIVEKLQNYKLTENERIELLGEVYQTFLKETYTEKIKGQRFTPRNVVDFIVKLIDPKLSEKIYDPACGTAGFLISALRHVKEELDKAFQRGDVYNPWGKIIAYAENNLYGTDIASSVVALAKANMILHGDGHTNIINHDGLIDSEKTKAITSVKDDEGGFDIIMTNPPFGGIKIDPEIIVHYSLAQHARSELTQVLFIERCTKMLKRGGRIGIILPDGVLSNPRRRYVVDYIREKYIIKAMVSLPKGTFTPYGADPKTHILLMCKKKFDGEPQGNIINMKVYNIGYTVSGKEEKEKDLPILLNRVKKMGGLNWG
jgi:type I restriction enzyme M protein